VIIGILAAIAVPKFSATKEKSFVATMKSDLRNLVTSEEAYFYDWNTYYNGAIPNAAIAFSPSRDVSVVLSSVSNVGWGATATHSGAPGRTCAIFYGNATAPAPSTVEGDVACN